MGEPTFFYWIFFSHSLLIFLRSIASTRIGRRKEPPGRKKMITVGTIFAMFFRCIFISFFSALVHFSSVFRVFIRSCISPFIARTSIRMASLFIMISLLRYFLIISEPPGTTVEVRSESGPCLFSWRLPFPPNSAGAIYKVYSVALTPSLPPNLRSNPESERGGRG